MTGTCWQPRWQHRQHALATSDARRDVYHSASAAGSQEDAEELTLDTLPQVAASAPAPGPLISPQVRSAGMRPPQAVS